MNEPREVILVDDSDKEVWTGTLIIISLVMTRA